MRDSGEQMKVAIYVNEGTTQVVLTPENEWEKNALKMLNAGKVVQSFWGAFYECQGGWWRENPNRETSLIFRVDKAIEQVDSI